MTKTGLRQTIPPKPKSVIIELSAIPEKFLEDGLRASQFHVLPPSSLPTQKCWVRAGERESAFGW
jgi:hypothetical protein